MMTKGKAAEKEKTLCSSHTSLGDSGEALPGFRYLGYSATSL